MTTKIKEAGNQLRKAAETVTETKHVKLPEMKPGQMFAQGDVGILRIVQLPERNRKIDRPVNGQVAPGNTKGSRHCVDECDAQFYRFQGDPLSDLCIEAREVWTLRHPEHGHVTLEPGLYQFVHQQNERRERVLD